MKKFFYLFLIGLIIGNGFLTTKEVSAQNETIFVSNTSIEKPQEELKTTNVFLDTDTNCMVRIASNSDVVEVTYRPILQQVSNSDVTKIIPYAINS